MSSTAGLWSYWRMELYPGKSLGTHRATTRRTLLAARGIKASMCLCWVVSSIAVHGG